MLPKTRSLLAGAAAACALAALPAAANAAEVTQAANGEIVVRDSGSEANDVRLAFDRGTNRMNIIDVGRSLRLNTDACRVVTVSNVECPRIGLRLELGGGADRLRTTNDLLANVFMGAGDDHVTIGADAGASNVDLSGGTGTDTVSYDGQQRPVRVEKDNLRNDGRAGDADNIRTDVETVVGTIFDDVLIGWNGDDILDAGLGNDTMAGVGGTNTFRTRGVADGADNLIGGTGYDYADYTRRTSRVLLSVDGTANDGAPGEGDNLSGIEALMSGSGNDVCAAAASSRRCCRRAPATTSCSAAR
jgi:hemolysin type calcium-binding protein